MEVQFARNGPRIPLPLLKAQEAGELVIYCGAGVSVPAGLPLFRGLVESVYGQLRAEPRDEQQEYRQFRRANFDRVFSLLEDRFGGEKVRVAIRHALTAAPDATLESHQALLDLARDRAGAIHLVTTNFDDLFERAAPTLPAFVAPALPVAKPQRWHGVVHIHGRIGNGESDLRRLVLSSADFGLAYLLEGWATRFLADVVANFTVLFVGYQADEPVIRYLVDAIAAERRRDPERAHGVFALVGHAPGQDEAECKKWRSKNIDPIPYDESDQHGALHSALTRIIREI